MTSEEVYLDIVTDLKEVNPKMGLVLEYLRPYYVYNVIAKKREDAIIEIDNRHPDKRSFANYYSDFFKDIPKFNNYEDKRDYFVELGKYILKNILEKNPNFKNEYDNFLLKVENLPKDKEYRYTKNAFDQIMYQVVYRCVDLNALYWGSLVYTTEIYKYLMNKAVQEIRDYKKNNEENISKKN